MTRYRNGLPQLKGGTFLMDGGLETTLVYHDNITLPCFASFDLLREQSGKEHLKRYYRSYLEIARAGGYGFILESPTWRASADWGAKMGYSRHALEAVNREAVEMMEELRWENAKSGRAIVVAGCIGPRGDGYDPGRLMSVEEAEDYHSEQVEIFAGTGADMISVMTMTNAAEAAGIARAARRFNIPAAISFTVETDGRLPTGQALPDAIAEVDGESGNAPAYFMINCAHPTHFAGTLATKAQALSRIKGIRANASRMSHAELDNSTELDPGNPEELAGEYDEIVRTNNQINVVGGCCGTDQRHLTAIVNRFRIAA